MSRGSITRTAQADEDLIAIWLHIAADGEARADRVLERIEEACQRLAEFPEMGVARDTVREGLRTFPVGSYLILYQPTSEGVEILRVLHGARQWQELL